MPKFYLWGPHASEQLPNISTRLFFKMLVNI
jgi:hypothetical protein